MQSAATASHESPHEARRSPIWDADRPGSAAIAQLDDPGRIAPDGGRQTGAFGLDDRRRAGAAEEVALAAVAAHLAQAGQLQRRLQALGDHGDAERVAEVDDRLDDRRVLACRGRARRRSPVDLDRLDREALEVGQRRVAGAEVVDGEVQAEAAQVAQGDRRRLDVGEQRGLGDLQPQRVGGDAGLAEDVGDEVGERRVDDLAGPDVDRERGVGERQVARPPAGELGQGVARARSPRSRRSARSPRPSAGTGRGTAGRARGAASGRAPRTR